MKNLVDSFVKILTPYICAYNKKFEQCKKTCSQISNQKNKITNLFKLGQIVTVILICGSMLMDASILQIPFAILAILSGGATILYTSIQTKKCNRKIKEFRFMIAEMKTINFEIQSQICSIIRHFQKHILSEEISSFSLIQQYKIKRNLLRQQVKDLQSKGDSVATGELYAKELELGLYEEILKQIETSDIEEKARQSFRYSSLSSLSMQKKSGQTSNIQKQSHNITDNDLSI